MVAGHPSYLAKLFDPIVRRMTADMARLIADAPVDAAVLERVEYLRAQANEGRLSEAERAEYAEYVEAVDILGIFQARARAAIARQAP